MSIASALKRIWHCAMHVEPPEVSHRNQVAKEVKKSAQAVNESTERLLEELVLRNEKRCEKNDKR